jgi:hypothetical protein
MSFAQKVKTALEASRDVPATQPIKVSSEFRTFISTNGMNPSPATMILWTILMAARFVFDLPIILEKPVHDAPVVEIKTQGKGSKQTRLTDSYPTDADDGEMTESIFTFVSTAMKAAPRQLIELVGAWQVKALKERNVVSYFKMAKADIPVERIMTAIAYLSTIAERVINIKEFKESIKGENWLVYHTAYASTQYLVRRFIEETQDIIDIPDDDKAIVYNACDQPWEKQLSDLIPARYVQLTYCYLEASKTLPDNWYQGMRAMSSMATHERTRYREAFKKYIELKSEVDSLDDMETVKQIKEFLKPSAKEGKEPERRVDDNRND